MNDLTNRRWAWYGLSISIVYYGRKTPRTAFFSAQILTYLGCSLIAMWITLAIGRIGILVKSYLSSSIIYYFRWWYYLPMRLSSTIISLWAQEYRQTFGRSESRRFYARLNFDRTSLIRESICSKKPVWEAPRGMRPERCDSRRSSNIYHNLDL